MDLDGVGGSAGCRLRHEFVRKGRSAAIAAIDGKETECPGLHAEGTGEL